MPHVAIDALPDSARCWVFAASRSLEAAERDALLADVDGFLDRWAAHGVPLTSARDWCYDRFLIVAVDEAAAGASGCSIDALTHLIREFERRFDVALLDHGPVYFRSADGIEQMSRQAFQELADAGEVDANTIVFDNTVSTLEAIRAGRWETAMRGSWHGRAFLGLAPPPLPRAATR